MAEIENDREDEFADEEPDPGDAAVLDGLRAQGADLTRERDVVHLIHLPSREAADALADILPNEGYDAELVEPQSDEDTYPWTLRATAHRVVDEASARDARMTLTELAAEHGGRYERWEAAAG